MSTVQIKKKTCEKEVQEYLKEMSNADLISIIKKLANKNKLLEVNYVSYSALSKTLNEKEKEILEVNQKNLAYKDENIKLNEKLYTLLYNGYLNKNSDQPFEFSQNLKENKPDVIDSNEINNVKFKIEKRNSMEMGLPNEVLIKTIEQNKKLQNLITEILKHKNLTREHLLDYLQKDDFTKLYQSKTYRLEKEIEQLKSQIETYQHLLQKEKHGENVDKSTNTCTDIELLNKNYQDENFVKINETGVKHLTEFTCKRCDRIFNNTEENKYYDHESKCNDN